MNNNYVSIAQGPEEFNKNIQKQIVEDGSNAAGVYKAEHNYTIGNIANGLIGPVEIEGIKNMPVTRNGVTKKFEHWWPNRAIAMDQAFVAAETKRNATLQISEKTRNAELSSNTLLLRNQLSLIHI